MNYLVHDDIVYDMKSLPAGLTGFRGPHRAHSLGGKAAWADLSPAQRSEVIKARVKVWKAKRAAKKDLESSTKVWKDRAA